MFTFIYWGACPARFPVRGLVGPRASPPAAPGAPEDPIPGQQPEHHGPLQPGEQDPRGAPHPHQEQSQALQDGGPQEEK